MTAAHAVSRRLDDLVGLFGVIEELQAKLVTAIQAKVDAMKCADVGGMREQAEKEREVIQRLHEREGLRCQLMAEIGKEVGFSARAARVLPVSQLADRLPASQKSILLGAADKLRLAIGRVARVNRVAGIVSRDLLDHLHWVFASVKPRDGKPTGYSGSGAIVTPVNQRIFEAIG